MKKTAIIWMLFLLAACPAIAEQSVKESFTDKGKNSGSEVSITGEASGPTEIFHEVHQERSKDGKAPWSYSSADATAVKVDPQGTGGGYEIKVSNQGYSKTEGALSGASSKGGTKITAKGATPEKMVNVNSEVVTAAWEEAYTSPDGYYQSASAGAMISFTNKEKGAGQGEARYRNDGELSNDISIGCPNTDVDVSTHCKIAEEKNLDGSAKTTVQQNTSAVVYGAGKFYNVYIHTRTTTRREK